MNTSGFFGQIAQYELTWPGQTIKVPVFYQQARMAQIGLAAHTDEILPLLPSSRLHPLRIAPARCLLVLVAMQHLQSDIGPYNELLIGFPCTLDKPSPQFAGTLRHLPQTLVVVHRLAVTTDIALQAGNELLATRKFMADIRIEESDEWMSCDVSQDGAKLLHMAVRKGNPGPMERQHNQMLSVRGGYLLRWEFIASEHEGHVSRHGADARWEWGSHPMVQDLARLKVGPLLECSYSPRFQGILGPVVESHACVAGDSGR